MLLLSACGKESARAGALASGDPDARAVDPPDDAAVVVDGSTSTTTDSGGVIDASDASSAPDFGPVEDVVTGGGGPVIDPSGGGSVGCASDTLLLGKIELAPSASTPKAFVDAWNSEWIKAPHGGLLLELRGLTGSAAAVKLAIGSPKPALPLTFATFPTPGVIDLAFTQTTRLLSGPRQEVSAMLFDASLPIGAARFAGVLDAKCSSATAVTLTLLIPVTAGSTSFGGSTLSALLGAPKDAIGSTDAWRIDLSGTVGGAS